MTEKKSRSKEKALYDALRLEGAFITSILYIMGGALIVNFSSNAWVEALLGSLVSIIGYLLLSLFFTMKYDGYNRALWTLIWTPDHRPLIDDLEEL